MGPPPHRGPAPGDPPSSTSHDRGGGDQLDQTGKKGAGGGNDASKQLASADLNGCGLGGNADVVACRADLFFSRYVCLCEILRVRTTGSHTL